MPWLGPIVAAKPNLGLAILAGQRSRRSALILITGSLVLLAVSLALDPGWPGKWRASVGSAAHFTPLLLRPGGFLVLLALLRYRDPDARLLLILGLIPQSGLAYEALPAATVARTRAESAVLALFTYAAYFGGYFLHAADSSFVVETWQEGKLVLWGDLLVPLALVLWRGFGRPRATTEM